jgi:cytochrome P450 family 9
MARTCRFFGVFEFLKPVFIIRDLELIRQISIKDFDNFVNRRSVIDESADRLFGKNLFILRDQKWRNMRSTLSPAFTGSKMRHMFNLITDISSAYMSALCEGEIEFKDFANKYCHDVIAKCSFGVSGNSLANPDNEFYKMGLYVTKFPLAMQLKFMG